MISRKTRFSLPTPLLFTQSLPHSPLNSHIASDLFRSQMPPFYSSQHSSTRTNKMLLTTTISHALFLPSALLFLLLPLHSHPHYLYSFLGFPLQALSRLFAPFSGRKDGLMMTLKGGTSQACAACKYQRRRCTAECPLAPYFPPDQPKIFQNAHKLFGVSNILKILKKLDPEQRATAMWSIIYQANERDRDPVHGCLGKICQLRYQIWHLEQELQSVHARLEMCRQHQQQQHEIPSDMPHHDQHVASQLELAMAPPSNALPLLNDHANANAQAAYSAVPGLAVTQEEAYSNNNNNAAYNSAVFVDSKDNNNVANPMWVHYPYNTINNTSNGSMAIQSQLVDSQPMNIQQQVVQDYDEMPFFMDDRQSFIDSKEAYDSSSEESALKDTTQPLNHVADNELKSAAACFSLTSVAVSTDK